MRPATFARAFFIVLGSSSLRAQASNDSLAAVAQRELGRVVRVTTAGSEIRGVIRRAGGETLYVGIASGDERAVIASAISKLEVPASRADRVQHRVVGVATGVLVGAGVGYLLAIPRVRSIERRPNHDGPFEQIDYVTYPILFGALGGAFGFAIGSRVGTWVIVYTFP